MMEKGNLNLVPNMIAKIKTYPDGDIPSFWNKDRMPHYMGMIVTIRHATSSSSYKNCFHIFEDAKDGRTIGWFWRDVDFIKVNTVDDRS